MVTLLFVLDVLNRYFVLHPNHTHMFFYVGEIQCVCPEVSAPPGLEIQWIVNKDKPQIFLIPLVREVEDMYFNISFYY